MAAKRKPEAENHRLRVVDGHPPAKVPLEDMPLDFLLCRTDRHDWKWKGDNTTVKRGYLIEFTRRHECERCEAWKEVTRAVPSFVVTKKRGNYAPGYLHDGGRLHSSEVFWEQLTRMGSKIKHIQGAD